MANMSYCRFENTLGDLRDCIDAMEAVIEGDKPRLVLNHYEVIAARAMAEFCQIYIEAYNELERSGKIADQDDPDFVWDIDTEDDE